MQILVTLIKFSVSVLVLKINIFNLEKVITEAVKSKLIAENKKSELQNLLCLPAVQFIKKV